MVAKRIALRVSQLTPCRRNISSVSSESLSCWFYICYRDENNVSDRKEMRSANQNPCCTQIESCDGWGSRHCGLRLSGSLTTTVLILSDQL